MVCRGTMVVSQLVASLRPKQRFLYNSGFYSPHTTDNSFKPGLSKVGFAARLARGLRAFLVLLDLGIVINYDKIFVVC